MKRANAKFLLTHSIIAIIFAITSHDAFSAVVSRRTITARGSTAQPTATATTAQATIADPEPKAEAIVENKSSQFSTALDTSYTVESDADSALAQRIREQRAALDAATVNEINASSVLNFKSSMTNTCDADLRKCMQGKCGSDFTKCATDTDMTWGNKINLCRNTTKCSAHEFSVFAQEIKADRDTNTKISSYNSIVDCGNKYNDCIITQCGRTFEKCLGKSTSDRAMSTCSKIANECKAKDNGLTSRITSVFGTLRTNAETQVKQDEQRLYALRDQMREQCELFGAMFDERTFDCVYTVNFFANNSETPYASKKLYAGGTFSCTPDWFGIDVTTFKENAYRLTREQTAASSAMLGSGLGTAVGALSSGAISRAIDRHKAEKAVDEAKQANADAKKIKEANESNDGAQNVKESTEATQEQPAEANGKEKSIDIDATKPSTPAETQKKDHEDVGDQIKSNNDSQAKKELMASKDTTKNPVAPDAAGTDAKKEVTTSKSQDTKQQTPATPETQQ